MTLHSLEIPDDPVQLPRWLENHIVGLDLAPLVAELSAVHGTPAVPGPSIRELLGDRLPAVLTDGLGTLPSTLLVYLLMRPQLLLDLQELVFAEGGAYWDHVRKPSAQTRTQIERGRQQFAHASLDAGAGSAGAAGRRDRRAGG